MDTQVKRKRGRPRKNSGDLLETGIVKSLFVRLYIDDDHKKKLDLIRVCTGLSINDILIDAVNRKIDDVYDSCGDKLQSLLKFLDE